MEFRMFPSVFKFFVVLLLLNIARAYQECNSEHNVFPHKTDVTKYYKCNKQHQKVQMQCPHAMQFNPSVGVCQTFIKQDQFLHVPSTQQRPPFYPDAPFHTHQQHSNPAPATSSFNKPGTSGKHNHGSQYTAYPDSPYHTENELRAKPYYYIGSHYPGKPFYYKPSHIGSGHLQPYHPHHHTIDYEDSYGQNYPYKPYDQGPSYLYPNYRSSSFNFRPYPDTTTTKAKYNNNSHHGSKPHHYGQPRSPPL